MKKTRDADEETVLGLVFSFEKKRQRALTGRLASDSRPEYVQRYSSKKTAETKANPSATIRTVFSTQKR